MALMAEAEMPRAVMVCDVLSRGFVCPLEVLPAVMLTTYGFYGARGWQFAWAEGQPPWAHVVWTS